MALILLILTILMMVLMPSGAAFLMYLVSGGSWALAIGTFVLMAFLEAAEVIKDGEPMFE